MILLILVVFAVGYLAIVTEHVIKINKAATALITAVLCWTIYTLGTGDQSLVAEQLTLHIGELSGILFFLLGAMTIVELIDAHHGFDIITRHITQTNKRKLLWIVAFITFFLSPILDNLTTTIVMISLLRKLVKQREERWIFIGMIIIASNAGGAWSPIGDVTTTMLWIGNQVTPVSIMSSLFLPSLFAMLVPLIILTRTFKGEVQRPVAIEESTALIKVEKKQQYIVFISGVLIFLLVPVFKMLTGLPPFMGILIGVGCLWIVTELMHGKKNDENRHVLSVAYALQKIDTPSILFFLGILLAVASLEITGILHDAAELMTLHIPNQNVVLITIGLLSSIIDNVPLVAAAQGMYPLTLHATDSYFWHFLAYTTGTGGSALIIGSAAGVAAMGMENVPFFWYLRKMTLLVLLGFFAGAGVFMLQYYLLS